MAAKTDDKQSLPTNDAWTGMLAVSLLALLIGSVLLFLDWSRYNTPPSSYKLPSPIVQDAGGGDAKEAPPQKADDGKKGDEGKKDDGKKEE